VYLPGTSRTGPQSDLCTAVSPTTLERHQRQARNARAIGAARAGSARRAAGLPGALTALVRDLQVLDNDLLEAEHDFSVDVIITLPIPCRQPRSPRGLYWDHLDPARISAILALTKHLAQPDKTGRPRDASTQSGCQFASHRASPCAFLLRLVPPAPLFTLADATLTLPMGSQTDTQHLTIVGRGGARGMGQCARGCLNGVVRWPGDDVLPAVDGHPDLPRWRPRNRQRGRHKA